MFENKQILPRLFCDLLSMILLSRWGGNASGPENDLIRLGDEIGDLPGDAVRGDAKSGDSVRGDADGDGDGTACNIEF